MTVTSLHHTMFHMSKRLDAYLDAREADIRREESGNDEQRAMLALDPLLADLHKRSLDADSQFKSLQKLRGDKDPMTLVAADMADSANSAYETRLLEIREDAAIKAAVKVMLKRLNEERDAELAETKQKFWDRLNAFQMRMRRQMDEAQTRSDDSPFAAWLMMMNMMNHSAPQMRRHRSFATAFTQASFGIPDDSMRAFAGA